MTVTEAQLLTAVAWGFCVGVLAVAVAAVSGVSLALAMLVALCIDLLTAPFVCYAVNRLLTKRRIHNDERASQR